MSRVKIIAETESDLPPDLVAKIVREMKAFLLPEVDVEVRANVAGKGARLWGSDYKLPTLRQEKISE